MDKRPYLNFFVTVLVLLLISFVVIMINQAAQLVGIAANLHPYLGTGLLIFFVIFGLAAAVYIVLTITVLGILVVGIVVVKKALVK